MSSLRTGAIARALRQRPDEVALDALKDLVPVLGSRGGVPPEVEVGQAVRERLDAARELVAGLVGVDRGDDGGCPRQSRRRPSRAARSARGWAAPAVLR